MKATRDIIDVINSLAPAARAASANGTGVDLANAQENTFYVHPGVVTDGTHTPKLQDSADNSAWADVVVATDQVGTLAAIASNVIQQVSYIGSKRFVRVVMTTAGATTGAVASAGAVVKLRKQP
jgi:hypothetical protein